MTVRNQTLPALTRFTAIAGLVVALLVAGLPQPTNAAPPVCYPWPIGCLTVPGIAGGGSVVTDAGESRLSLFATTVTPVGADPADGATIGRVHWWTPGEGDTALLMESTAVEEYGPMPNNESGRVIRGTMSVNGDGEFPFVVRAVDGGFSGDADDSVEIHVGDAVEGTSGSGFTYSASGTLETGDFQLLNFTDPPTEDPGY